VHRPTGVLLVKVGLSSDSLAVVVVQQPAETFVPMHFAFPDRIRRVRTDSVGGWNID